MSQEQGAVERADDERDLLALFPLDDETDRDRERFEDWLEAPEDDRGITR
jgi:hypothetical protein